MFSKTRLMSTAVLASAILLVTSPLAAALRSKPGSGSVKAHSTAHFTNRSGRTSSHHAASAAHQGAAGYTTNRAKKGTEHIARSSKPRFHGQQSIDSNRTLEIQQALIREHYLPEGYSTGEMDQPTRDALTRLQFDNHWQTKILPDARALIKLGLGPSQQNLLNPETAAIAMPNPSGLDNSAQGGAN